VIFISPHTSISTLYYLLYYNQYHEELTIRIDSLTNMGWGVGRVQLEVKEESSEEESEEEDDDDRNWTVMVPHVVVGELVSVSIFRNHRSYSEADLIEVLEASPHRVEPKCPLAGICGGCQYQHMSIDAQRDWKTKHVKEVLLQQEIQGYDNDDNVEVLPTIGTSEVYEYRSKLTPHYQAPKEVVGLGDGTYGSGVITYELGDVGFQRSSNRNSVDVPECPIATTAINEKYKKTRELLHKQAKEGVLNQKKKKKKRGRKAGATGATLLFRHADDDEETGESVVVTDHNQYMTTTVRDLKFRYLAGNFFQNNDYVLPLMVDAVVEAATRPTAAASGGTVPSYLIDCYCGSGLFALSAASHFELCVGIEVNSKAVEEATANAELNGINNCQFVAASAEAIFTSPPKLEVDGHENQEVKDFPRDQTVVVLDPPRKGCSTEFLEQLYEYSPQRIVYMSCGPATQARDAKGIVEIGGYEIVSIQPFDVFPQTKHIESLIVFEKKQNPTVED
jgi:23S rRNA (uracil1939-C5)-methyltransferase/tRNA (uracil-5-)-methyltransferase